MYFHISTAFGLTQPNEISEDSEFIRECPQLIFLESVPQVMSLLPGIHERMYQHNLKV